MTKIKRQNSQMGQFKRPAPTRDMLPKGPRERMESASSEKSIIEELLFSDLLSEDQESVSEAPQS